ncbi:MAG TPA: small multi-drug export protein [Thermoguttaceae bacterium]|nr:small multi-drug export protein [Thermoguttaceae bacterium]HPP53525.1 small multi-drug export protein [Thermoguttaceae bacterium]
MMHKMVPPERISTAWLQKQLQSAEEEFTVSFRRQYPVVWWTTLLGPFVLSAAILAAVAVLAGGKWAARLVGTAAATFFFFGRFVILGGEARTPDMDFFTPGQLMLLVTYMDLMTAILLTSHSGFLFRIPFLGPRMLALVEDGQYILKSNPWMKRLTFAGLVAFVMFPLAATGSVGGSIFGRLLGMSRTSVFIGVALGSVLGNGMMYLGANMINRYLDRNNPWLTIGGIAVVALLIFWLNYRYQRMKRQAMQTLQDAQG